MKTHLHTLALHLAPTTIQPSAPNHHTHSAPNTLTLNTLNVYACCQKEQATTFNPLTLRMLPADITPPSHHYSKHRRHDWDQVRFCLQTARDTNDMMMDQVRFCLQTARDRTTPEPTQHHDPALQNRSSYIIIPQSLTSLSCLPRHAGQSHNALRVNRLRRTPLRILVPRSPASIINTDTFYQQSHKKPNFV